MTAFPGRWSVSKVIEKILLIPVIAAVVGIAIVEVISVYKYVKYQLSRK